MFDKIKSNFFIFVIFNIVSLDLIVNKSVSICRLTKKWSWANFTKLLINFEILFSLWINLLHELIMLFFLFHNIFWLYSKRKMCRTSKICPFFFIWERLRFSTDKSMFFLKVFFINGLDCIREPISNKLFALFEICAANADFVMRTHNFIRISD